MADLPVPHLPNAVCRPWNKVILNRFLKLEISNGKVQVTYVWVDDTRENLRMKTKTMNCTPENVSDIPVWIYDGSSHFKDTPENSHLQDQECLVPVALYKDPFGEGNNKLVLCNIIKSVEDPGSRMSCMCTLSIVEKSYPWFGMEQEYTILDTNNLPLGWTNNKNISTHCCGVGVDKVFGREIAEAHYRACHYAGINISSINSEAMPSRWKYTLGVYKGIAAGDNLWMSRFILQRVAEEFGVVVTFRAIPVEESWKPANAYINFSTESMRFHGAIEELEKAVIKLRRNHSKHLALYSPNESTESRIYQSIILKTDLKQLVQIALTSEGTLGGYLQDRRPPSNCDPYSVMLALLETCILNK